MIVQPNFGLQNTSPFPFPDMRTDAQQQYSPLSLYQDNEDGGMAEQWAEEIINLSGAVVLVKVRSDHGGFDDVWEEDVQPQYLSAKKFKAYFKPQPLGEQLTKWGVDTPNQTTVVFARKTVFKEFGVRMLRAGDMLELPYGAISNSPRYYEVTNVADAGNFRYRWLYYNADVKNLTGDPSVRKDHA